MTTKTSTRTLPILGPGVTEATLRVNGRVYTLSIDPRMSLLDVLREHLGLTGTKKGCNQGACGACTVLIDGKRITSCLTLALMYTEREITTIEGLAQGDQLDPMQEAFIKHDAFQCGYCTPGQILSAVCVLTEGYATSDEEMREAMSGNLCRCAAYPNIIDALQEVKEANHATH